MSPRLYAPTLAGVALLFVATRVVLNLDMSPVIYIDTFKYLGGADSIWAGRGLAPVFEDLPISGGALHAVPGYSVFIAGIWALAGGPTVSGIAIANSLVSFLGFAAGAHIAAKLVGRWAAVLVLLVLCAAPTLAWLEYSPMPDGLAAPLLLVCAWIALQAPPSPGRMRLASVGAFAAGALMGAQILLRTASQVYLPIPPLVALHRGQGWRPLAIWVGVYALGLGLSLAPWMLHNYRTHGVYAVSSSTGRTLFFSAAWTQTVARPPGTTALILSDKTFRRLIGSGFSIPAADAKMREFALRAYREGDTRKVLEGRLEMFKLLFASDLRRSSLRPLAGFLDYYLENRYLSDLGLELGDLRFGHRMSSAVREALFASERHGTRARPWVEAWWTRGVFDGWPLVVLFLAALPLLWWVGPGRWAVFWIFAAPPFAFVFVYIVTGAPFYRYQVGIHPFMYATAVIALHVAVERGWRGFEQLRRRFDNIPASEDS